MEFLLAAILIVAGLLLRSELRRDARMTEDAKQKEREDII
jgi:hypothetical protein